MQVDDKEYFIKCLVKWSYGGTGGTGIRSSFKSYGEIIRVRVSVRSLKSSLKISHKTTV